MNLPAKTEYACLAVLELAAHFCSGSGEPVRVRQIAETHGIPSPFLVQILLQLKGAGLVESMRGAAGGYRLIKDPDDITLGEVMAIIEGPGGDLSSNAGTPTAAARVLLDAWREVDAVQRETLAGITFAHLLDRVRGRTEKMYYI